MTLPSGPADFCRSSVASWFVNNPTWLAMQRYFMGFVLSGLALRPMLGQKRMS